MARYRSRHHRPFHIQQLTQELLLNDREDSGVQLDEPSSPLSRHMDDESADIVQQLTQPSRHLVGKVSKQPETPTSSLRHHRTSYDDKTTRHFPCDMRKDSKTHSSPGTGMAYCRYRDPKSLQGNSSHISGRNLETCVRNSSAVRDEDICDKVKSDKAELNPNLEEDEGLDIPDAHTGSQKGHNSGNSRHDADSSENSDDTEPVEFYLRENSVSEKPREITKKGHNSPDLLESHYSHDSHSSAAVTSKGKDSKKRRFRKLLTGGEIRRSQSLGCAKDLAVPDHALFLKYSPSDLHKHDPETTDRELPRRQIHKTCSADSAMMSQERIPCDSSDPADLVKHKQKSSLAKNVRRKFQKLRRRNTDSLLSQAIMSMTGGSSKVTPANALEWGQSFEALLGDKNGLELFRNFLKSEFSEENLEFWVACEEFKSIRTNKLVTGAQRIYTDFIAIKAPKQINLDSKTRLETVTCLESPTRDMFRQAQKRIQFLMENDSYKRFLESEVYRSLLKPVSRSGSR